MTIISCSPGFQGILGKKDHNLQLETVETAGKKAASISRK